MLCFLVACAVAAGPGPVGLADARWTSGFWAERFAACRSATVPATVPQP